MCHKIQKVQKNRQRKVSLPLTTVPQFLSLEATSVRSFFLCFFFLN